MLVQQAEDAGDLGTLAFDLSVRGGSADEEPPLGIEPDDDVGWSSADGSCRIFLMTNVRGSRAQARPTSIRCARIDRSPAVRAQSLDFSPPRLIAVRHGLDEPVGQCVDVCSSVRV
jgi:hypothetical protein